MLPQTKTIRYGNDRLVFREEAPYEIVFQIILKAKPPFALLRAVLKVGVERTCKCKTCKK